MLRTLWNLRVALIFWRLGVRLSNAMEWAREANYSWAEGASPSEAVEIELVYWEE